VKVTTEKEELSAGDALVVPDDTLHQVENTGATEAERSPAAPAGVCFLSDLAGRDIPALVIKGRCDHLSWSSAQEYPRALPDAGLLYLDGSGHNAYQDEPERYMAGVRAFVSGRCLPDAPLTENRPPEDYEGPPRARFATEHQGARSRTPMFPGCRRGYRGENLAEWR
jgi:hypothetical protein